MSMLLPDDPRTIELLRSTAVLMAWLPSRPPAERARLLAALADADAQRRETIEGALRVVEDPQANDEERRAALLTADEALAPPRESTSIRASSPETLESAFVARLRELMSARGVTQQQLAARIGCSQPAISQLLTRERRPRRETLLAMAAALGVAPTELWPKLEVLEMFEAVEELTDEHYTMTDAEAQAMRDPHPPRPKIPVRRLPKRREEPTG